MQEQTFFAVSPLEPGDQLVYEGIPDGVNKVVLSVKDIMAISTVSDGRTRFLYELEPSIDVSGKPDNECKPEVDHAHD